MRKRWSMSGADRSGTLPMGEYVTPGTLMCLVSPTLVSTREKRGSTSIVSNLYFFTLILTSVAGDNGDGLSYAAVGGMLIRDLILGKENDLAHTFSPSRQHSTSHMTQALKSIPHVIKENLMDQAYYLKWASTATKTMTDIEDLVPGQGDVVREGIHPVAVYKDDGGEVHKMTAICP